MTPFASFCRAAVASSLALVLASACGGTSFSNGDGDGGEGGTSSGGGTRSGGSGNKGGSNGTAGKSTGGTSAGGTGTAGTSFGGSPPGGEACTAPAVSGTCEAYFERWYHDVTTGLCLPFVYGGCDGNENNYESFEDC